MQDRDIVTMECYDTIYTYDMIRYIYVRSKGDDVAGLV